MKARLVKRGEQTQRKPVVASQVVKAGDGMGEAVKAKLAARGGQSGAARAAFKALWGGAK